MIILTILSIYALMRMIIDYGLSPTAMLSIGLIGISLGIPFMLCWAETAGGVVTAVGLALIAMGL